MAQHGASCLIAICVLRGVSLPPVRRRKDRSRKCWTSWNWAISWQDSMFSWQDHLYSSGHFRDAMLWFSIKNPSDLKLIPVSAIY